VFKGLYRRTDPLLEQKRQERRFETARRLIRIRIGAATAWFLFNGVFGLYGDHADLRRVLPVTAVYAAASLALYLASRRFPAVLRHSWMSIPLLDLWVIFLTQYLGTPVAWSPVGNAAFSVSILAILVVVAQLSMRIRNVFLTAGVAIVLEVILMMRAGLGPYGWFGALIVLSVIGVAAAAVVEEFSTLLRDVVDERARISREIHDTLAQGLAGICVQLEIVATTLKDSSDIAQEHLDRARGLARSTLAEARRSVWDLRQPVEPAAALERALQEAVQRVTIGTRARIQFDVSGVPRRLSADVEANVLRIAQEALANASKHADASTIQVKLRFEPRRVFLRVTDDGRGFDPEGSFAIDVPRFGLTGMLERAEQVGGSLEVRSEEGFGTEVTLAV
jgi:signal transduction histidine kinase